MSFQNAEKVWGAWKIKQVRGIDVDPRTVTIDTDMGTETGGYCESCYYEEKYLKVEIYYTDPVGVRTYMSVGNYDNSFNMSEMMNEVLEATEGVDLSQFDSEKTR